MTFNILFIITCNYKQEKEIIRKNRDRLKIKESILFLCHK